MFEPNAFIFVELGSCTVSCGICVSFNVMIVCLGGAEMMFAMEGGQRRKVAPITKKTSSQIQMTRG